MKNIYWVLIFFILFCLILPPVTGDTADNEYLKNISQTMAIPTTGTALLGTKASMTQYESWLNACASEITNYSNIILNFFGFNNVTWSQNIPPSETPVMKSPSSTITVNAQPTLNIPEIPQRTTILQVTGSDGWVTSDSFTVNDPYWELWYTADPLITGGQDATSSTGSYSAVFPVLSIQILDKSNNSVIETITPPGGLDKSLWERSGMDPRPWVEKFYWGYSQYYLKITAKNINSYIVEARVPSQPEVYGTTAVPISSTPQSSQTQKQYIIACRVYRQDSNVNVIFEGGRDAASLQYISLTENGQTLGNIGAPNSQTPLQIGATETFPVSDQDPEYYVIGTGHFMNGDSQKIFETTLEPE